MKRILADFNSLNSEPLDLVKLGHSGHLSQPLQLDDIVELYDDELIVRARILYDPEDDYWLAAPDWSTQRATPPELAATIH